MTCRLSVSLGALALAGAVGMAHPALAQQRVEAGTLSCEVSGGFGAIIASQKELVCTFVNSAGQLDVYGGVIRKFGLDIGATAQGQIVWNVFAPSAGIARGALAGSYGGATAEATVGAGLGANVLFGGSNRTVALQPISLSGQAGLNLAVGIADLELRPARPVQAPRR